MLERLSEAATVGAVSASLVAFGTYIYMTNFLICWRSN